MEENGENGAAYQALVELRVELADGSEMVFGSDAGWDARRSPILESSIYDGEVYDARLESEQPTDKAVLAEAPAAPLSERLSPPVRILHSGRSRISCPMKTSCDPST